MPHHPRTTRRTLTAGLLATGVLAALLAGVAPATADDDPVGTLTGTVQREVEKQVDRVGEATQRATAPRGTAQRPSSPPPAPSSQDEDPGNEVADPTTPDHGGTTLADAQVLGEDAGQAGQTRSDVEDDDSTRSSSTLLALGGQRLVFADADSDDPDQQGDSQGGPADLGCTESAGQICLGLLYADAAATDDGTTSHSESSNGVLVTCVGDGEQSGEQGDPDPQQCEGPVGAGLAQSGSRADRDQESGRTTASSETGLLVACLGYDGENCALEGAVLSSEGRSDSGGSTSSASRDSSTLLIGAGGEEVVDLGALDPADLPGGLPVPGPPGIPVDCGNLACAYLDQGETYLGDGIAGHAQEALRLKTVAIPSILGEDVPLLSLLVGRSETLVHNDGGEPGTPVAPGGPTVLGDEASQPARPATVAGVRGGLPNTGGPQLGLLACGLLALGGGSLLLAVRRTRSATTTATSPTTPAIPA